MPNTQLSIAFTEADAKRNEQKALKATVKEVYEKNKRWSDIKAQVQRLNDEKKMIEDELYRTELTSEIDRLEALKADLDAEDEKLSSIALTEYVAGRGADFTDDKGIHRVPEFKVKFRKEAGGEEEVDYRKPTVAIEFKKEDNI